MWNWDRGRYEASAFRLLPAAELVVDAIAPRPGEVVLDLGCGTGNAALVAAARGARVIGVDPAARLLEVAREAASDQGADAEFVLGDAANMPVPTGSVDAVTSVFGVLFAPDAPAAAAEIARVLRPAGRLALSAWIPAGVLADQARLRRELVAGVRGDETGQPTWVGWHDPETLTGLFGPHGFDVSVHEYSLAFTDASPEAYADAELADHPGWVEAREVLEPAGRWAGVRADLVRLFSAANTDPDAFRVTSRYVIATAARR